MDDAEQVDADHLVVDLEVRVAHRLAGRDAGVVVDLMHDTELASHGLRVGDEGTPIGHVQMLLVDSRARCLLSQQPCGLRQARIVHV